MDKGEGPNLILVDTIGRTIDMEEEADLASGKKV